MRDDGAALLGAFSQTRKPATDRSTESVHKEKDVGALHDLVVYRNEHVRQGRESSARTTRGPVSEIARLITNIVPAKSNVSKMKLIAVTSSGTPLAMKNCGT